MYVARIPNRGSPPAILLRESYRAGGKVRNRTLANLSRWPEEKIDALSRVLKGLPPQAAPEGAFEIVRSLPHGHVAAVLGTLGALGLQEVIDPLPSRARDLVCAMVAAQVIDPSSKLACARGLRSETATSSLGQVLSCSASTTSPRPPSRAAPAPSARSGTPKTACAAGSRSSTGCLRPTKASRSRSRSSRATPATRRRFPRRSRS